MARNKPQEFLLNNPEMEKCSICGETQKLTFEHMPPQGTGNNKPVNIIGLENMTPLGGYLYQSFKKSPRGMGGYKLCKSCNNNTGGWYSKSYINHSNLISKEINKQRDNHQFEIKCKLKPLNFLKQIICILLCSDQATGVLREHFDNSDFILNKINKEFPKDLYITQNITLQPTYGFKGYTSEWDSKNGFAQNIEFVYRPFYFRATFDKAQILENSMRIDNYATYDYDEEIEITYKIELPSKIDYS